MSPSIDTGSSPGNRRFRWLIALAAPALLGALVMPPSSARAAGPECPATQDFAVGGLGDPLSRHVPGSAGAIDIRYPASLAPLGSVPGDVSVAYGEAALSARARQFRSRCPDTPIHVSGYSMGALVAGNARDRWTADPVMSQNVSFTLIADPRADDGAMARLPSLIPGFTHTGKRPPSSIPTSSVCRTDSDFICHTGDPLREPTHFVNGVLGYLLGDHAYRRNEISADPGDHVVAGTVRVGGPDVGLPIDLPTASVDLPVVGPIDVPAVGQLVGPPAVAQVIAAVVPQAQLSLTEYLPTPLKDYAPSALAAFVPDELGEVVLPPVVLPPVRNQPVATVPAPH